MIDRRAGQREQEINADRQEHSVLWAGLHPSSEGGLTQHDGVSINLKGPHGRQGREIAVGILNFNILKCCKKCRFLSPVDSRGPLFNCNQ